MDRRRSAADEDRKKIRQKPKLGRGAQARFAADGTYDDDVDEEEVHKRWEAAYGPLTEEARKELEKEFGDLGI